MPDPMDNKDKDSKIAQGAKPDAGTEPGAAEDLVALKRENARLRAELDHRPSAQAADQLAKENDLLRNQLAKAPPQGPPRGTVVHFRRGKEDFCRPALIASDGFLDSVRLLDGSLRWHALIQYGEPYNEPQKGHSFQTNRGYDPGCSPDTWHAPDECTKGYKDRADFPGPPAPAVPAQAP